MRRLVGFLLLLSGCAASVAAQAGTHAVSGRVVDPQGLPVPRAEVRLLGASRVVVAEVITDDRGRFMISRVAAGRYELRVEAASLAPYQRVLDVPGDVAGGLEIALKLTPVEYSVTVTGRHGVPEETFVEPASVRIRDAEELAQRDPAHLPRMLAEEPGVNTQETTPGQGSPVLRGQGAQTVLYLLDGIRFNNSTYRSGNVQYLGWVPADSVESVEVFLGPAGTHHGSDALGGAVNVMSTPLPPWSADGVAWSGEWSTFFSSADLAAGSALRAAVAGRRIALSLGGSWRRHQELRPGGGTDSHNTLVRFLGLTPQQARGVLGSRLVDTDYAQSAWYSKLGFRLDRDQFLTFSWLQSEQYGVRRYDRLLGGEGRLRSDLQPQRLSFGYARYQRLSAGPLRSFDATFSLNRQTDGQISQTRAAAALQDEVNRTTALGYAVSTTWAPLRRHTLTAGGEVYDEFIFGRRFDMPLAGTPQAVRPRFPNGTRYLSLGLYVSDDWEAVPEKVLVESGVRLSAFRFRSRADKNVFIGGMPTVPDATETFRDVTFNAGLSYTVRPPFLLFGRIARGFRAPSVFDLGEQGLTGGGFEVSPRDAVAIGAQVGDSAGSGATSTGLPWRSLQPEVLWSYEGGLRWRARRWNGTLTFFDSEYFDAVERRTLIVTAPVVGQSVGNEPIIAQDSAGRIFTAADPRPVVSRANIGRVRVHGLEAVIRVDWTPQWSSQFKAAVHRGRELDTGHSARKITPDMAILSLRWTHPRGRVWFEGWTEISGPQTRLNPSEIDDPRIGATRTPQTIAGFFNFGATRLGLVQGGVLTLTGETLPQVIGRVLGMATSAPLFTRSEGFATLNFRGGLRLRERNEFFLSLGNVTDANYRRHGSGFDAPGVNLSLSYRRRW